MLLTIEDKGLGAEGVTRTPCFLVTFHSALQIFAQGQRFSFR
jgi:hypothetical protein